MYDLKKKILDAVQTNQALLEHLCELIHISENQEIKCRIATTLDRVTFYRMDSINLFLKLIDNKDNSAYLHHLLIKLNNVAFEDSIFKDEEISEETKKEIIEYLIKKLFRETDERYFNILAKYVRRILTKETIPFLISKLKIQLTDETCDSKKIEGYYNLIAYCAQTISYPEFYALWHQSDNDHPPRNH